MTASEPDPLTPFTPTEEATLLIINATAAGLDAEKGPGAGKAWVLKELTELLEAAATVELATIPIYLYTYYSINRRPASNKSLMDPPGGFQGTPSDPHIPNSVPGGRAEKIQVYANQAGAAIMSVAVEEMLHMSLSSNILFSLGGEPCLYQKSPWPYPCNLPAHANLGPDHEPVRLSLAPLSYQHLWDFLEIEWPERHDAIPERKDFRTIGQVYSYIRCLVWAEALEDPDFQKNDEAHQIQPDYYSPNNIDTLYAQGPFIKSGIPPAAPDTPEGQAPPPPPPPPQHFPGKRAGYKYPDGSTSAVYEDAADSHAGASELLTIDSKRSARQAIDTICDQGEGFNPENVSEWDDLSDHEESHFYKFVTIQTELEKPADYDEPYRRYFPPRPEVESPITAEEQKYFVYPYPENPSTAGYSDPTLQAISNACNALYQYMLILTETTFKVQGKEQKALFYRGMHMSMIWILDKIIQAMRNIPLNDGSGNVFAATFENIDLGDRSESYAALCAYANAALTAIDGSSDYSDVPGYLKKFKELPDVGPHWKYGESTCED